MPGSPTTPGRPSTCDDAPGRVAFHQRNDVGTQIRGFRGRVGRRNFTAGLSQNPA